MCSALQNTTPTTTLYNHTGDLIEILGTILLWLRRFAQSTTLGKLYWGIYWLSTPLLLLGKYLTPPRSYFGRLETTATLQPHSHSPRGIRPSNCVCLSPLFSPPPPGDCFAMEVLLLELEEDCGRSGPARTGADVGGSAQKWCNSGAAEVAYMEKLQGGRTQQSGFFAGPVCNVSGHIAQPAGQHAGCDVMFSGAHTVMATARGPCEGDHIGLSE